MSSAYTQPSATYAEPSNADLRGDDVELRETRLTMRPEVVSRPTSIDEFVTGLVGKVQRDTRRMVAEARRIGQTLGRKGFYRFPAGNGIIQGETIDLAYALAQAWGYSLTRCVVEDVEGRRVKLRGIFVDLATVVITERDYVAVLAEPQGKFAEKPDQAERWNVMQEQAAISKAVRGAILAGLPAWYVEAGFQAALDAADAEVLAGADGKPMTLVDARKIALDGWASKGISRAELEAIVGDPPELWGVVELEKLLGMWRSVTAGRLAIERIKAEAAERAGKVAASGGASDDAAKSATGVKRTRKPKATAKNQRAAEVEQAEKLLPPEKLAELRARLQIPAGYSTFDMSPEQLEAYNAAISGAVDAAGGGVR